MVKFTTGRSCSASREVITQNVGVMLLMKLIKNIMSAISYICMSGSIPRCVNLVL